MTFAISACSHRRCRRQAGVATRGFTLIELLLVVGILAVLMGLLLPAVAKTYSRAIRIRTQADLQSITTALEAYKADFGVYPPVTSANAGAAVLGKALLGPADAAHYYTTAAAGNAPVANDALQNPPEAYAATKTYQAGDFVMTSAPTFASFTTGVPPADIWVCVRNDTQADGTPRAPADGSNWWSRFVPYDGNDGNGVKARLAAAVGGASDLPHAAAGKVYGPYLDTERFRTRGTVIVDRYDRPVLYFPINTTMRSGSATGSGTTAATLTKLVGGANYSGETPLAYNPAIINERDNHGAFANDAITPVEPPGAIVAKMSIILGDYNADGVIQAATELPVPTSPFLLWTAGPDKRFGPVGHDNPASYVKGDYYWGSGGNAAENQATALSVDDVTNFRP